MSRDGYYENIDLHIRWSDRQDLVLSVKPEEKIGLIKEKIHHSAGHTERKYIRLIHNGKVLKDDQTLKSYDIGKINATHSKAMLEPPPPVYIHCSLSDYIPQNTASDSHNNQPQMIPPTGFDRLRESGFTEEDIQNIRAQFHRLHGTAFDEADETSEEARNLEEQWMDNTGETLPDGTVQGTYKEMMWGLMFGFFLGIICLFWFRESVFSRRQQMGIIAVLYYGKLNVNNTKKPNTPWASYLSTLTVPKYYFSHFYVIGFLFGFMCSFELHLKHGVVVYILQSFDYPSGSQHLSLLQCRVGMLLMNVHLARRVYESFKIEVPSKESTMHASHYLIGVGFYGAMVLGTWLEGASNFGVWPTAILDKGKLNWSILTGILLFLYASIHQYNCHCILASLRRKSNNKYYVPKGDWFEWIASPHYFADILIYLSLCILYNFKNKVLLCGLVWTIINLSITANQTHRWYVHQFPSHPELKNRWRIIPGIY